MPELLMDNSIILCFTGDNQGEDLSSISSICPSLWVQFSRDLLNRIDTADGNHSNWASQNLSPWVKNARGWSSLGMLHTYLAVCWGCGDGILWTPDLSSAPVHCTSSSLLLLHSTCDRTQNSYSVILDLLILYLISLGVYSVCLTETWTIGKRTPSPQIASLLLSTFGLCSHPSISLSPLPSCHHL